MTQKNGIKILDCTLRDGGYINNWDFGTKAKDIVNLLQKANIDFIEIGFITKEKSEDNQTLFNDFNKIRNFLPENYDKNKILGMIHYGEFPAEFVPDVKDSPIGGLRVIFKKEQKKDALEYCKSIKAKGYKLFINPTFTNLYSDNEFITFLKEAENLKPDAISIVDSMGLMKENDVLHFFNLIQNNLNNDISLCFHSHNNLQLSFANAQVLLKACKDRELALDATLFGMGRGAGNLCTEIITQYINDNYNGDYKTEYILKLVNEQIMPIFKKSPWGYSVPYYFLRNAFQSKDIINYLGPFVL